MNIGIAGAGITGLATAYHLSKKGHRVTIFEQENHIGGLASWAGTAGWPLEKLYHHFFIGDSHLIYLLKELGLDSSIIWNYPSNGLYSGGRLYPFTSPMDLLRFNRIPFIQRLRLGILVYRAKFMNDLEKLERITAARWIAAHAGAAAYDRLWKPLLKSKFDVDAGNISAAWIWNKFKLRGSTRSKNMSREQLGYLSGGFKTLLGRLEYEIKNAGGSILLSHRVCGISPAGDGRISVETCNGNYEFDRFIFTAAPPLLANAAGKHFTPGYAARLKQVKYKANLCMLVETESKLSDYYWITVAEEDSPFVLVIEHTNMIDKKYYGTNIIYLSRYLDEENPLFTADDAHIESVFLGYLEKMFPGWDKSDIKSTAVYRSRYAQPVVSLEYSKTVPSYQTEIKNLYIASMAQIFPEDRGINYSVRMGEEIAHIVGADDQ